MLEVHDCTKGEEVLHGRQWGEGRDCDDLFLQTLYMMFVTL